MLINSLVLSQMVLVICMKILNKLDKDCKIVSVPANAMLRIEAAPATTQSRTRTFNMIMKDVTKDFDVVAGTLSIKSTNAKALINSEDAKSFILKGFA